MFDVSIHAFREEGDQYLHDSIALLRVSIHAFREEGDEATTDPQDPVREVSIHAFREEGDKVLRLRVNRV